MKARSLPGYWHFSWLFWMQPVELRLLLRDAGFREPRRARDLFGNARREPNKWAFLLRLGFVVLVGLAAYAPLFLMIDRLVGFDLQDGAIVALAGLVFFF